MFGSKYEQHMMEVFKMLEKTIVLQLRKILVERRHLALEIE